LILAVLNYRATNAPFTWVDPANMPALNLTGDAVSPAQALPFSFRFFGEDYTALYVSANGLLGLANPSLGAPANTDLPNGAAPNNIICPFWDDLNPSASSVRFGIVGTAPSRRAIASWLAAAGAGSPSATFSFQAILEESSQDIVFQYLEVQPGSRNASAAGKSATVGLEHRSGMVAARYAYNGSTLLSNAMALRFIAPPGSSTNPPPQAVSLFQPTWDSGTFTFAFTGQVGRIYEPQYIDPFGLTLTNWHSLGIVTGAGAVLIVTNRPAPGTRVYRIESK
jgi:hypothetical protein